MPTGFGAIQQAAEKIKSSGGEDWSKQLFLKLPSDGDTATVRFLEEGEDIFYFWYHDFSKTDKQEGWKTKVPCLDQEDEGNPCPGCREGLNRKFQGLVNIIWRDAPVFKRDEDDKIVKSNNKPVVTGKADQNAIWRSGITVFNKTLRSKDKRYSGLGSRDFEIERQGEGLSDTSYSVEPADPDGGPQELTDDDAKLRDSKYDLQEVARFKTEEEFEAIIQENLEGSDEDDGDLSEFINKKPHSE